MQANFPFHCDPDSFRLPKDPPSADLKALYTQDQERWSVETLATARRRFGRKLRAWIDPEDINQDVWFAAWVHYRKIFCFSDDHRWRWLVVTTRHKIIDARRLLRRIKDGGEHPGADAAGAILDLETFPDPHSRTPLAIATGRELRGVINRKVQSLRPIERKMIQLRFFDDCSWAEVGRRMDRPASNCESIVRRSKHRLQSMLAGDVLLDLHQELREEELN